MTEAEPTGVYQAIHLVMQDMAKGGVAKRQTNSQQNFQYRGVDDVMDALAPSLSAHGLIIVPHVQTHTVSERFSRNQTPLLHTLLRVDYDFICVKDGSKTLVGPIYGEAMDAGDKATNKAMAAAYKYACVQTFCIPITGDDPDANSHEIARAPKERAKPAASTAQKAAAPAPMAPPARAPGNAAEPMGARPGGMFGYGKKFVDTPWNVMKSSDLEWFLNAERTPQHVREKIVAEMEWRDYESDRMHAMDEQIRAAREAAPLSEEIP